MCCFQSSHFMKTHSPVSFFKNSLENVPEELNKEISLIITNMKEMFRFAT